MSLEDYLKSGLNLSSTRRRKVDNFNDKLYRYEEDVAIEDHLAVTDDVKEKDPTKFWDSLERDLYPLTERYLSLLRLRSSTQYDSSNDSFDLHYSYRWGLSDLVDFSELCDVLKVDRNQEEDAVRDFYLRWAALSLPPPPPSSAPLSVDSSQGSLDSSRRSSLASSQDTVSVYHPSPNVTPQPSPQRVIYAQPCTPSDTPEDSSPSQREDDLHTSSPGPVVLPSLARSYPDYPSRASTFSPPSSPPPILPRIATLPSSSPSSQPHSLVPDVNVSPPPLAPSPSSSVEGKQRKRSLGGGGEGGGDGGGDDEGGGGKLGDVNSVKRKLERITKRVNKKFSEIMAKAQQSEYTRLVEPLLKNYVVEETRGGGDIVSSDGVLPIWSDLSSKPQTTLPTSPALSSSLSSSSCSASSSSLLPSTHILPSPRPPTEERRDGEGDSVVYRTLGPSSISQVLTVATHHIDKLTDNDSLLLLHYIMSMESHKRTLQVARLRMTIPVVLKDLCDIHLVDSIEELISLREVKGEGEGVRKGGDLEYLVTFDDGEGLRACWVREGRLLELLRSRSYTYDSQFSLILPACADRACLPSTSHKRSLPTSPSLLPSNTDSRTYLRSSLPWTGPFCHFCRRRQTDMLACQYLNHKPPRHFLWWSHPNYPPPNGPPAPLPSILPFIPPTASRPYAPNHIAPAEATDGRAVERHEEPRGQHTNIHNGQNASPWGLTPPSPSPHPPAMCVAGKAPRSCKRSGTVSKAPRSRVAYRLSSNRSMYSSHESSPPQGCVFSRGEVPVVCYRMYCVDCVSSRFDQLFNIGSSASTTYSVCQKRGKGAGCRTSVANLNPSCPSCQTKCTCERHVSVERFERFLQLYQKLGGTSGELFSVQCPGTEIPWQTFLTMSESSLSTLANPSLRLNVQSRLPIPELLESQKLQRSGPHTSPPPPPPTPPPVTPPQALSSLPAALPFTSPPAKTNDVGRCEEVEGCWEADGEEAEAVGGVKGGGYVGRESGGSVESAMKKGKGGRRKKEKDEETVDLMRGEIAKMIAADTAKAVDVLSSHQSRREVYSKWSEDTELQQKRLVKLTRQLMSLDLKRMDSVG
eukprot:GHVQ01037821.1.p1 GENE.GHVQ01037821.1~~GHVQ01037821.1.p1  ORF type:complete len:1087 (+),score=224.58 GHVQ01037821.1:34-3294(+)